MARRSPADVTFVLIGGRNIGGELKSIDDRHEALIEQSETLGDAWGEQSYVGVRTAELTLEGFYNDAQGSIHDAMTASADLVPNLCYTIEGSSYGAGFIGWAGAVRQQYERLLSVGELTKVRATFQTQGPVDIGKQLFPWGLASSPTYTTTGSAVDWGASSTGAAGYLQYGATAGEANIRILHSADNLTFTELFTWKTTKGVATGVYDSTRQVTTAGVNRYTAMAITTASATGTGTTAGLYFFLGLARNLTTGGV